jgi:hypothetical protein
MGKNQSKKNETSRGRSPCGIVLRRRSSRRKVAEAKINLGMNHFN